MTSLLLSATQRSRFHVVGRYDGAGLLRRAPGNIGRLQSVAVGLPPGSEPVSGVDPSDSDVQG